MSVKTFSRSMDKNTFLYLLTALTLDIARSRGLSVSHGMCGTKVTFEQESGVGAALATLLSIYISRHMIPRHCCDGRAAIATIAARQCAFHRPAPAAAPMTAAMAAGCHAAAAPASFIFLLLASDVGGVVSIQI